MRRVASGAAVATILGGCIADFDFDGYDTARERTTREAGDITPIGEAGDVASNGDFRLEDLGALVLARGEKRSLTVRVVPAPFFAQDVAVSTEGALPGGVAIALACRRRQPASSRCR